MGASSLWLTMNSIIGADTVSVQSQAILVVLAGGMFTLVTLLVNRSADSKQDKRAVAAQQAIRDDRAAEKEAERQAMIEKEERDYARQDKVAADAARFQQDLISRQTAVADQAAQAAQLLVASNKKIAVAAERTAAEQTTIKSEIVAVKDLGIVTHALVNSDKTAAMKRQKVSFIAQRAALVGQLRLAEQLSRSDSEIITPAVQATLDVIAEQVKVLDTEITTLTDEIDHRLAEQHRAEEAVAVAKELVPAGPPPGEASITIENATIEAGVVTVQPKPGEPGALPPPAPPVEAAISIETATIEAGVVTVQPKDKPKPE